ncbi:MAG: substrate-binding domain-containing protein [Oscillospiraceae bacterium]
MGYDAQRIKLFECPQEIVIVASPKHPFAAAKQLKLADLVNEPFVLMPQFNSYRHQFDMELAHQKLSIRPFLELESTSMVMQLLEHNPYLSVLPRYTARRRAEEGRLAILPVTDCHMEQWSQLVAPPRQGAHAADPRHGLRYRAGREHPAAPRGLTRRKEEKIAPIVRWGRFAVCEQKLSRSRTAGGRSDALS